jgi:hypothetical protein
MISDAGHGCAADLWHGIAMQRVNRRFQNPERREAGEIEAIPCCCFMVVSTAEA